MYKNDGHQRVDDMYKNDGVDENPVIMIDNLFVSLSPYRAKQREFLEAFIGFLQSVYSMKKVTRHQFLVNEVKDLQNILCTKVSASDPFKDALAHAKNKLQSIIDEEKEHRAERMRMQDEEANATSKGTTPSSLDVPHVPPESNRSKRAKIG